MQDVILLEGIQIPAALGVTAAERRARRPVLLDVEVARDLRAAGRSDRIRNTLHYKRIFEVVEDVGADIASIIEQKAGELEAWLDGVVVTARFRSPMDLDLSGSSRR